MAAIAGVGRPNQKQRTRKDLLDAAARLVRQGSTPTLEEVAAEALVSRATAYRYFPSIEALLVEASVHMVTPTPDEIFASAPAADPLARVLAAEAAMHRLTIENEAALRAMLAHTVLRAGQEDAPVRQNRRTPLIEAALEPAADEFAPDAYARLVAALAVLFGIESHVALKDVLQLDDATAGEIKQWAAGALVEAARRTAP